MTWQPLAPDALLAGEPRTHGRGIEGGSRAGARRRGGGWQGRRPRSPWPRCPRATIGGPVARPRVWSRPLRDAELASRDAVGSGPRARAPGAPGVPPGPDGRTGGVVDRVDQRLVAEPARESARPRERGFHRHLSPPHRRRQRRPSPLPLIGWARIEPPGKGELGASNPLLATPRSRRPAPLGRPQTPRGIIGRPAGCSGRRCSPRPGPRCHDAAAPSARPGPISACSDSHCVSSAMCSGGCAATAGTGRPTGRSSRPGGR